MFCHLPRSAHGTGPLDAIYGKVIGWACATRCGPDFLLAFYATWPSNLETRPSSRGIQCALPERPASALAFPTADISDPWCAVSAVALHLVRHMLVTEARGAAGEYSGNLLLLRVCRWPGCRTERNRW